jgi:DNA-binding response OmpR family regulator
MTCVLVIVRDQSASAAIRSLLELEGFEVVVCNDGPAGLRAVESSAFDTVIIDVFAPQLEGLDTVKAVYERAPTVPIIAIAPRKFHDCLGPEQDFLALAANFGAAACLYKPLTPRDLVMAVTTCIDDRGRHPAGADGKER